MLASVVDDESQTRETVSDRRQTTRELRATTEVPRCISVGNTRDRFRIVEPSAVDEPEVPRFGVSASPQELRLSELVELFECGEHRGSGDDRQINLEIHMYHPSARPKPFRIPQQSPFRDHPNFIPRRNFCFPIRGVTLARPGAQPQSGVMAGIRSGYPRQRSVTRFPMKHTLTRRSFISDTHTRVGKQANRGRRRPFLRACLPCCHIRLRRPPRNVSNPGEFREAPTASCDTYCRRLRSPSLPML